MKGRKLLKLYLKIFIIILLIGLALPYVIDFILNLVVIINKGSKPGTSIFVFNYQDSQRDYFYYVFKLLEKIIDFS